MLLRPDCTKLHKQPGVKRRNDGSSGAQLGVSLTYSVFTGKPGGVKLAPASLDIPMYRELITA